MNEIAFRKLIKKGIYFLYKKDATLLEEKLNVNERTITHRLAFYLTPLFHDYDVDCEYNRMSNENGYLTDGDYWAKTINVSRYDYFKDVFGEIDAITDEDLEAKTVYPDIIIHKRKESNNLAVIEVKMKWKSSRKGYDYKKLKAYKADLKYKFAVYLELDENPESLIIDFV